MKFLITGGAGFIGSHVASHLSTIGHTVHCVDALYQYIYPVQPTYLENVTYRHENLLKEARVHRVSTIHKDGLRRIINHVQPDTIIHLAALPLANIAVRDSEEAFEGIIQGTTNLLEILRDYKNLQRMVYISSSMVYGDFYQDPMPESAKTDPKEIYGGMKLNGEILVRVYSKRYDIPYTILRPSAVYGPSDNNRRVLQNFIEGALSGRSLTAKNPETTLLDFTYIKDLASGLTDAAMSKNTVCETLNLTSGRAHNLSEALEAIQTQTSPLDIKIEHDPDTFRPKRGTLDISKAKDLINFAPKYSLSEGINEYIDYIRHNNPSIMTQERSK